MTKREKQKVKLTALGGRLLRYADDYMTAVCRVVVMTNDGTSERNRSMLDQALRFRSDVDEILADISEGLK